MTYWGSIGNEYILDKYWEVSGTDTYQIWRLQQKSHIRASTQQQ